MRAIALAALLLATPALAMECDSCSAQGSVSRSIPDRSKLFDDTVGGGEKGRRAIKAVSGIDYWDARTKGTVATVRGKDIITYSRNKGADDHAQANATAGNYSAGGNWPD